MSKIRVHELAKELNKTNKELLDFLKSKEIEVKSHMSSLSDEQIQMVKGAMAGKATKTDGEDAQKKKNIVQVFRPQNSKQNNRPKQNNHKQNQNQNNNNNHLHSFKFHYDSINSTAIHREMQAIFMGNMTRQRKA